MEDDGLPPSLSLPQSFSVVNDKSSSAPIVSSSWCPTMDLIALLTSTNQLHIHRLAWEKLFTLQLEAQNNPASSSSSDDSNWSTTHVSWRPDGKALAVASSDGCVQLVSMESRKVEAHYFPHSQPITCMQWVSRTAEGGGKGKGKADVWKSIDITGHSLPQKDTTHRFFAPLPPLPSSTTSASGPAPSPVPFASSASEPSSSSTDILLDASSQPPSLLLTSSSSYLHARLHGTLDVLHIDLTPLLPPSHPSILSFSLHGAFEHVILVIMCDEKLVDVHLPLPLMSCRINELSFLSSHFQQISHLLSYASSSLSACLSRYQSIRTSLANKFSPLSSLLIDHSHSSTASDQLIHLLLTSIPSYSVQQWVSSYLNPAALSRQQAGVESSLLRIQDALRVNFRRAAEELIYRLAEVRGCARWREKWEGLGVEEEGMSRLLEEAGLLLLRVEQAVEMVGRVRRGFSAFFPWLIYQVGVLQKEEEGEVKADQTGPFDMDSCIECIQHDLFSDRLSTLLSSSDAPSSPLSSPSSSSFLPVTSVPKADSSTSLLTTLESLRSSFSSLLQSPCTAISERKGRGEIRVIQEVYAGQGEAGEDVALCWDGKGQRQLLATAVLHPLIPHPLIVLIASSSLPTSYLALPCPALSPTSHPSIVCLRFFSPSSLLLLVRYTVQRRSSELRHLQEKERMIGNVYTRLYQIKVRRRKGWREVREEERRRKGLSLLEWVVGEWEERRAGEERDEQEWKQRCLYGECGRSISVGRERGVCAILLTAMQPQRARQQKRRILLLDMMEDDGVGAAVEEMTVSAEEQPNTSIGGMSDE